MARLREFDERKALETVRDLFWQKGYEGTSYADLSAATGLGRGSLYAAFGDKQALYRKALTLYIDEEVQTAVAILKDAKQSAAHRIRAYLDLVVDAAGLRQDRRGCFLCNAAIDMASDDPETGAMVQGAMKDMRDALLQALEGSEVPDKAASAEHLLAVYAGMRTMARAGLGINQLKRARDAALNSLT